MTTTTVETIATDHADAFALLTTHVREALAGRSEPHRVLEAGCGRSWSLGEIGDIHITGVDLDDEALRLRVEEQKDLDEAIHGDLMAVAVDPGAYDLVFSSFVLEHLDDPEKALDRFSTWLRPGGLIVVIIPDKDTAKGFITRFSPFFLHVWYYRWVKGRKTAGKPGYEPYRTFYRDVVGVDGMQEFCRRRGHRVLHQILISTNESDDGKVTSIASKVIDRLSFGRLKGSYCNVAFVISSAGPPSAPSA